MTEISRLIAGALFDFIADLTGKEEIRVGSSHTANEILERLQSFAQSRGLSLEEADVQHWEEKF
jgi:hypothetical protein